MSHFLSLEGKSVVITGAARGIGLAIAQRLARAKAHVAVTDINREGAEAAAAHIRSDGGLATALFCDVSDIASIQEMIAAAINTMGQVDILINNAGIVGRAAPIWEQSYEEWHSMIDVDLNSVFYCCKEIIPHMLRRGSGRIITISSIAGKEGNPNMVPYSAAKAGVIGLTKALAKEVARQGIIVNCVAPALIETHMVSDLTPQQAAYLTDRIPLGRLGRPEEVAALVHWLASDDASFSTGAVFDLSGGRATY